MGLFLHFQFSHELELLRARTTATELPAFAKNSSNPSSAAPCSRVTLSPPAAVSAVPKDSLHSQNTSKIDIGRFIFPFERAQSAVKPQFQKAVSYAAATGNKAALLRPSDVFVSTLSPLPSIWKGDIHSIEIPDVLYAEQVEKFHHALIGRLILSKGDNPSNMPTLRSELQQLWGIAEPSRFISIGKGFYTLQFTLEHDKLRVYAYSSWQLSTGVMRIRDWITDFNPHKLNSSCAQICVRIWNLPYEYWHLDIISGIANILGTPLKIDGHTTNGNVGHYARVLIEMDLSKPMNTSVMIDRGEASFFVDIEYEDAPSFCGFCNTVGHHIDNCMRTSVSTDHVQTAATDIKHQVAENRGVKEHDVDGGFQRPRRQRRSKWVPKGAVQQPSKNSVDVVHHSQTVSVSNSMNMLAADTFNVSTLEIEPDGMTTVTEATALVVFKGC